MVLAMHTMVDKLRRSCGAERAHVHMTPQGSNKGGRYEVALQKAYQSTRSSDRKPEHLETVRDLVVHSPPAHCAGTAWMSAEADDGMAQAAWAAYAAGTSDLCVIASRDKDLRIAPGLHFNADTGEIEGAEGTFGYIEVLTTTKRSEKTGKVSKTHKPRGYGTKFFWWQMLMGDSADSIPGIPRCGIVSAADMLQGCDNDYDCLHVVKEAYKSYGSNTGFVHWETKEPVPWAKAFVASAQLLWMQRTAGDIDDVRNWMKEIITCANK